MTGKRKPAPKTADSNHIRARGREEKRGTKGIEHDERRKAAPAEQNWSTLLPNLHDQEKAARARQECLQRAEEKDRQRVAVDLFIEEQRHRRTNEFINFADIADWFARRDNLVVPNETARSGAYDLLRDDLRAGDFEEDGTSQVLFMHPSHDAEWISRRRTVDCETERVISLLDVIDTFTPQNVNQRERAVNR